ncbi:unnamed protein product [Camellia sinensis]
MRIGCLFGSRENNQADTIHEAYRRVRSHSPTAFSSTSPRQHHLSPPRGTGLNFHSVSSSSVAETCVIVYTSQSNQLSLVFGTMLKQAYHKLCAHGGDKIRLCLYSQTRGIHCGQPSLGPRSFFGVEDYLDDDNSRPYTYQKEKKSKNTDKHVSFKQRTIAYMEPFTLDVFISKRFVSASFTHRVTSKQVAVAGTNSKDIKAALKSRSDIPACLAVGRILAERAREADVYTASYTPRERDKFEGKIRAVVQSLIDNGIDVKYENGKEKKRRWIAAVDGLRTSSPPPHRVLQQAQIRHRRRNRQPPPLELPRIQSSKAPTFHNYRSKNPRTHQIDEHYIKQSRSSVHIKLRLRRQRRRRR